MNCNVKKLQVLDRFRDGLERILITTNVMSRGIDVEQVTIVVNYDLPVDVNGKADCETYLHRIGRTGRQENDVLYHSIRCPNF